MNFSLSYFIQNSSKNFQIKSVFRKLIKVLCWLWIFTYVTIFISSYGKVLSCFTNIIFPTITFSYTTDEVWLVLSFKLNIDASCFPSYIKGVFFFCKILQFWVLNKYCKVLCLDFKLIIFFVYYACMMSWFCVLLTHILFLLIMAFYFWLNFLNLLSVSEIFILLNREKEEVCN